MMMMNVTSLEELREILPERYFVRITRKWDDSLKYGFGTPQMHIDINNHDESTLLTVIISFQGAVDIFKYFRSAKFNLESMDVIHMREDQVAWMEQARMNFRNDIGKDAG